MNAWRNDFLIAWQSVRSLTPRLSYTMPLETSCNNIGRHPRMFYRDLFIYLSLSLFLFLFLCMCIFICVLVFLFLLIFMAVCAVARPLPLTGHITTIGYSVNTY